MFEPHYARYWRVRSAIEKHGEAFKRCLLNFVKSTELLTEHFADRKKEIESRISDLVKDSNVGDSNFEALMKEISPVEIFDDPYDHDSAVMYELEAILKALEDCSKKEHDA